MHGHVKQNLPVMPKISSSFLFMQNFFDFTLALGRVKVHTNYQVLGMVLPIALATVCRHASFTIVFLQRVSIACYAERCISYDRFCLTV